MPLQLGISLAAPADTLPEWLRAWAEVNSVTHVMDACRALLNSTPPGNTITATLLWSAALVVVLARSPCAQPPGITHSAPTLDELISDVDSTGTTEHAGSTSSHDSSSHTSCTKTVAPE